MGGKTFTPGIWHSHTITIAAGTSVYLDGEGDPTSTFLIQADLTLVAAAGCKIVLMNGAKAENVVWAFGSSVVFGAGIDFEGSILAGGGIVFGADNQVNGCVVSLAAITFGAGVSVTVTKATTEPPTDASTEPPVVAPTISPTELPTAPPTNSLTKAPTEPPTKQPTEPPTKQPTKAPTNAPTKPPTRAPTEPPTDAPTEPPSDVFKNPTPSPTASPPAANTKSPTSSPSETAVSESVCENFAVHAGSAITFAASNKVIGGDVGISPGTSITGAYALQDGALLASAAESARFAASVHDAWVAATETKDDANAFAVEMGGKTFTPGIWHSHTITIAPAANVYLDGEGDPASTFLIQADLTMVAGAGSKIVLMNGAKAENVVWALGTSVVVGAGMDFEGSILSGSSIVFGADVQVNGCVVALAAITFGAGDSVTP